MVCAIPGEVEDGEKRHHIMANHGDIRPVIVIGPYYHPSLKILPLWTVLRTEYPSIVTKLVPPMSRCDTHLGESSIIQIQIQR